MISETKSADGYTGQGLLDYDHITTDGYTGQNFLVMVTPVLVIFSDILFSNYPQE